MVGRNGRDLRLGKFYRDLAALDLVQGAEQAAVAAVREQRLEHEAVDRLAADRRRDQRQLQDRAADVGRNRGRQPDHVEHQSGAIIVAAGIERRGHERARRIIGSRALS